METLAEKYTRLRPEIKQGDLILFHGKKALARTIQKFDSNAYYNHVGVVGEIAGALFIIDSNAPGVNPARLSHRVLSYEEGDFSVLRPIKRKRDVYYNLHMLLKTIDNSDVKYDYFNGFKAMLNRRFGFKFKTHLIKDRKICSMFVYEYALSLDMIRPMKDSNKLFFPQDYIREGFLYKKLD
jgi:hypothetical protein